MTKIFKIASSGSSKHEGRSTVNLKQFYTDSMYILLFHSNLNNRVVLMTHVFNSVKQLFCNYCNTCILKCIL